MVLRFFQNESGEKVRAQVEFSLSPSLFSFFPRSLFLASSTWQYGAPFISAIVFCIYPSLQFPLAWTSAHVGPSSKSIPPDLGRTSLQRHCPEGEEPVLALATDAPSRAQQASERRRNVAAIARRELGGESMASVVFFVFLFCLCLAFFFSLEKQKSESEANDFFLFFFLSTYFFFFSCLFFLFFLFFFFFCSRSTMILLQALQ